MRSTCHSEFGKIHSLFIKPVKNAFLSQSYVDSQWQSLNYLAAPDRQKSIEEYDTFSQILIDFGIQPILLPKDDKVTMDSIYCRDAAIATNEGMILCNMGKEARHNEPYALHKAFITNSIPILGAITTPGSIEGGDVAWVDEKTLAVGHTYRTNTEGIKQLKGFVQPQGVELITVPLPHYKGPSDVFHLMSIFSPVDADLAVVYSPLMPISFRDLLLDRGIQLVEVPDEEFDSMGCNVLAIAPSVCLVVKGNPKTKNLLEKAGCRVIEYEGNEISIKGGGGPTCLTRPIWRMVK